MKVCKIIATYFGQRTERDFNFRHRKRAPWPSHRQFSCGPEGVLSMIKDQVSIETDVDAGVECDTIIVNNRSGFKEGDEYIRSINGQKTRSGGIISIEMDNIGGQFGSYDRAYSEFAGKYDYWILNEDDIVITGYHYYKKLIDKNESCYAIIGIVYPSVYDRRVPLHAASAALLLHKDVLEQIKKINGKLPHPVINSYKARVRDGEIAWSQRIEELGYKIVYTGLERWDHEVNYCLPYRELIERFFTVENFKQSEFYRGVGWLPARLECQ